MNCFRGDGKGDGEGEWMEREGGWRRGGDGHVASCFLCPRRAGVFSSRRGVLVAWGCPLRVGLYSSHGHVLLAWGVLIAQGGTGRAGVFLLRGGVLIAPAFSSCGGDIAIVAPVRLAAPC
jgi:hypothetical protein